MNQKPLLVFVVTLVLTFSGCLDFGDDELELTETADSTKQEPVGETNMTSLEKRITDLESTIAEYELPKVYFLDLNENNYSWMSYMALFPDYEYYKSDDGYLSCFYSEKWGYSPTCNLNALYHDSNGMIEAYSWEGSETDMEYTGMCQENTDPLICLIHTGGNGWIETDVCSLASVNQILTLTVYDNDGNSASVSYNLDYDSVCTVEYNPDVCEDGASVNLSGILYNCVNGQWVNIGPIICPQDENVTNHACVPCPGNTTNEAGDDASGSDTTCDGNEPPIIWSFTLMPENITEETTQIATNLNATDPEGSSLSVSAELYLNGQLVDQVHSEYLVNFVFVFDDYGLELMQDDIIHVGIGVMDDSGQSATTSYSAQVG